VRRPRSLSGALQSAMRVLTGWRQTSRGPADIPFSLGRLPRNRENGGWLSHRADAFGARRARGSAVPAWRIPGGEQGERRRSDRVDAGCRKGGRSGGEAPDEKGRASGRTALLLASQNGCSSTVMVLLNTKAAHGRLREGGRHWDGMSEGRRRRCQGALCRPSWCQSLEGRGRDGTDDQLLQRQ
jgi:hypothetical protein